jgi:hypothetical protein
LAQSSAVWRPKGTPAGRPAATAKPAGAEKDSGASSAGTSLGIGGGRATAKSPLGREMAYTLKHGWDYLTRMPKVEPDPLLLLRAARACWLLDDMDAMCVYYREAAAQLRDVVEISGRRTGTASEYWRLALGALWMVSTRSAEGKERQADQAALRSFGFQVIDVTGRLISEAGQPLDRMALEMSRLRAAWYAADAELPRYLAQAEQRVAAMDANNRGLWQGERDQLFFNAVRTVIRERPERMGVPISQLDEYLTGQMVRPPTVMDLVDEDLIALEAAAVKAGAQRLSLRAGQRAGARKGEVV